MTPSCSFETITPAVAKEWLERNSKNRKLGEPQVHRLAAAIKRGEWMQTTDAIGIDANGTLVNGQHRLSAIIQADTPVSCLVIRNVNPEIIKVIDQGVGRNFAQILQMDGRYPAASAIATATTQLYNILGDFEARRPSEFTPTTPQLIELFAQHPSIEASVEAVRDAARKCSVNAAVFAAYHYLMSSVDSDLADEFFDRLDTGFAVEDTDPVYLLREKYMQEAAKLKPVALSYKAAWLVKAWEATRLGVSDMTVRKLKWTPTGNRPEGFPKVSAIPFITAASDEDDDEAVA